MIEHFYLSTVNLEVMIMKGYDPFLKSQDWKTIGFFYNPHQVQFYSTNGSLLDCLFVCVL